MLKEVSRVPMNNLGDSLGLVNEIETISLANLKILCINCINSSDTYIYEYAKKLENFCLKNTICKYRKIENSQQFEEQINEVKPDILIIFGHGLYLEHKNVKRNCPLNGIKLLFNRMVQYYKV